MHICTVSFATGRVMDLDPDPTEKRERAAFDKLLRAQQLEDDTRWLMSDPRGRRLVWGWLERAGIYQPTFTTDALQSAFNEGGRNAGLQLLAQVMDHAPADFIRMQAEAQEPR